MRVVVLNQGQLHSGSGAEECGQSGWSFQAASTLFCPLKAMSVLSSHAHLTWQPPGEGPPRNEELILPPVMLEESAGGGGMTGKRTGYQDKLQSCICMLLCPMTELTAR